jgi:hypothetical protein
LIINVPTCLHRKKRRSAFLATWFSGRSFGLANRKILSFAIQVGALEVIWDFAGHLSKVRVSRGRNEAAPQLKHPPSFVPRPIDSTPVI